MEFGARYFHGIYPIELIHNNTVSGRHRNLFYKSDLVGTCFNGFKVINNIVRKNNGVVIKGAVYSPRLLTFSYYFNSIEDATAAVEKLNALQLAYTLAK